MPPDQEPQDPLPAVHIRPAALPLVEKIDGHYRITFQDAATAVDLTADQLIALITRAMRASDGTSDV